MALYLAVILWAGVAVWIVKYWIDIAKSKASTIDKLVNFIICLFVIPLPPVVMPFPVGIIFYKVYIHWQKAPAPTKSS